jgi:hypothetical protein
MYVVVSFQRLSVTSAFQDVDLVVMTTTVAQSALKQMLCDADASFYTVAAKTPGATYRVLYYRLTGYRRCCKVDILTPGTMNIPAVPARRIRVIKELPVMPFSGVLFLKLQAWEDHNHDPRAFMRSKQYTDASDIQTLLKIAVRKGLKPAADKWAPDWFIDMAKRRAKRFMAAYGGEKEWKAIGVVG